MKSYSVSLKESAAGIREMESESPFVKYTLKISTYTICLDNCIACAQKSKSCKG